MPTPMPTPGLVHKLFWTSSRRAKKDISGCHFCSDEEAMMAVEEWANGKDPDFFSSGLMALEHRWSKCIILEGNNI